MAAHSILDARRLLRASRAHRRVVNRAMTDSEHTAPAGGLAGTGPLFARARSLLTGGAGSSPWTSDLVVLAGFLSLVVIFGRPFTKLGIGHLYVTEPVLLLLALLAVRRTGIRGAWERLRAVVPLALGLLLLAGAIATLRGLYSFGLDKVTHDVGLIEYALMIPIVAVVVDRRERAVALLRTLAVAGAIFGLEYLIWRLVERDGGPTTPNYAVGIYMALFVFTAGSLVVHGLRRTWGLFALLAVVLATMQWAGSRTLWLSLLAGLVVLAALAPRGRQIAVAAIAAVAFVLSSVASYGIDAVNSKVLHPGVAPGTVASLDLDHSIVPSPVPGHPGKTRLAYVANDSLDAFSGGTVVHGATRGGTAGALSRRLDAADDAGALIELRRLNGLKPGQVYTIRFDVKPLTPIATRGRVGDVGGTGWGFTRWRTKASTRWQHIAVQLRATARSARLVIVGDRGAPQFLVDSLEVVPGKDPGALPPPRPVRGASASPSGPVKRDGDDLLSQAKGSFAGAGGGDASSNASWRLAIWKFMLQRAERQPVFGVGFGRPTNFRWRPGRGGLYDARKGDPFNQQDVTGPHNSFVNIVFRTGLSGTLPLLALLGIALLRLLRTLRRRLAADDRALLVTVATMLVFTAVTACFSVSFENPYIGLFFWTFLGLSLVAPRLLRPTE